MYRCCPPTLGWSFDPVCLQWFCELVFYGVCLPAYHFSMLPCLKEQQRRAQVLLASCSAIAHATCSCPPPENLPFSLFRSIHMLSTPLRVEVKYPLTTCTKPCTQPGCRWMSGREGCPFLARDQDSSTECRIVQEQRWVRADIT